MSELLFSTERTKVTRLSPVHADQLVELDSDPEVMRYINGGQPTPRERIVEKLETWTRSYDAPAPAGFWGVRLNNGDRFVGWVHLRPDRLDEGYDELGYRLRRDVWGQGLATEVSRAMIAHTFRVWKRSPVVARTLLTNKPSQRVMEKCGMRREMEFVYPQTVLPGWSEQEREAVRYRIDLDTGM